MSDFFRNEEPYWHDPWWRAIDEESVRRIALLQVIRWRRRAELATHRLWEWCAAGFALAVIYFSVVSPPTDAPAWNDVFVVSFIAMSVAALVSYEQNLKHLAQTAAAKYEAEWCLKEKVVADDSGASPEEGA